MNPIESVSWEALGHSWRTEISKEVVDSRDLEHRVI